MNFLNRYIKAIFLILIILSLVLGLRYKNGVGKEHSRTEFLMDTACTITAYGKDSEKAVAAAFDTVAQIHALTNFYDNTSDVSRINAAGQGEAVRIDRMVTDILATALEISDQSGGAFDVTVAPLSQLWSFADSKKPPQAELISQAKTAVNYKSIILDTSSCTVTKTDSKIKIDLGGAAKGYAADCAEEVMKKFDVSGGIIDLGGNIKCFGNNPKTPDRKWRIGVQIPFSPTGEYGEILSLDGGSVVTSGTYQRSFEFDGTLYHHILDPHTGYPSNQPYNSVTIVNESALLADCLSTACFVLGEAEGTALAKRYNAEIIVQ